MEFSDHKKPQIDLNKLLPDVYVSDVGTTINDQAFNRMFTKTDTTHIAGDIGNISSTQIQEPTTYRQAHQLVPTMVSKLGDQTNALSFKMFRERMELLGVDFDRFDKWCNSTIFNWVPPIHLDKLINYRDYFWNASSSTDTPQYLTIENKCKQKQLIMDQYALLSSELGDTFEVISVDYVANSLTVYYDMTSFFPANSIIFTNNSNFNVFNNAYWTVNNSYHDSVFTDQTIITLFESMAHVSNKPPLSPIVDKLWFDTSTDQLFKYSGAAWIDVTDIPPQITIYQQNILAILEAEINSLCGQQQGWDTKPWDDNQIGDLLWSTTYLSTISSNTAPISPVEFDLWYKTDSDVLYQWTGVEWVVVVQNFSAVSAFATGLYPFDDVTQTIPEYNQWQQQNNWIPKSAVTDSTNIQRAQRPIIEYDSRVELNTWSKKNFLWKYRKQVGESFALTETNPTMLEMMPVLGYVVSGNLLYLFNNDSSNLVVDNNFVDSFQPGSKFVITNNLNNRQVYTSSGVLHRPTDGNDPAGTTAASMVTIVTVEESISSPYDNSTNGFIIVPEKTSFGDPWKGYHYHWLLSETFTTQPSNPVPRNTIYVTDINSDPVYQTVSAISAMLLPQTPSSILNPGEDVGIMNLTSTFQEITTYKPDYTTVMLDSSLRYSGNPLDVNYFCLEGNSRVYLNGIRVYGGYEEILETFITGTYVGNSATLYDISTSTVSGITFDNPLPLGSVIRIEVCPESLYDMGKQFIAVRTIEDDNEFTEQLLLNAQPVHKSLNNYVYTPQNKNNINQYPNFNIYNVATGDIVNSNCIFGFKENQTAPIDPFIKKRIDSIQGDYLFEQTLLDQEKLLAYRMTNYISAGQFWYNPVTGVIQYWHDNAWTPFFISDTNDISAIKISNTNPTNVTPLPDNWKSIQLWYTPYNNTLYKATSTEDSWEGEGSENYSLAWIPYTSVVVGADPSLQTIWRAGNGTEQTVPVYTNSIDVEVPKSEEGDWRYPDQWFYNPQHQNHQVVSYNELVVHIKSILTAQQQYANESVVQLYSQDMFNYGLGGTIHDYDGSFDTLISAIGCDIVSIPMIIDYSNLEYRKALHIIKELFNQNITTMLHNDVDYIESIISIYENNELNAFVYGDTSAYIDGSGVKNWPATPAILKMVQSTKPYLNITNTSVELVHHDGHRSDITIDDSSITNYVDPVTYKIYKWPSQYSKQDLQLKLANLLLEIETRLYNIIDQNSDVRYQLTVDPLDLDEVEYYDQYKLERFLQFVNTYNIELPFVNTIYNNTDPFTWNYTHCNINDDITPNDAGLTTSASWQQLYTNYYGTPYPHLEPWIMQGYASKPDWWDQLYLNTTQTRRWIYNHSTTTGMWENIRQGIVPEGYVLPDGTISDGTSQVQIYYYMSVNIDDVDVSGYGPDQLLPPYFPTVDPIIRSIYNDYLYIQNKPISADYVFGDGNVNEWTWKNSVDYRYDQLHLAFLMQPMKFVHYNFAPDFITINYLPIDTVLEKVYSQTDALFHGDIFNDQRYLASGLNQWYVNYNRTNGYDTSIQLREQWVNWTPKMTYQTAGIVDPDSVEITNSSYDLADNDAQILLVNNGVVDDIWVDGFKATIVTIPPSSLVEDTQSKWRFELSTLSPTPHDINYYGVISFPCGVDYSANTLTAYQYNIVEANPDNHLFYITGDHTNMFQVDGQFTVTGSLYNDNTFTISASSYELSTDRTKITVSNPTDILSTDSAGVITLLGYDLPWVTGNMIVITTDSKMPLPLYKNTPYYVYRIENSNSFKLALTQRNAIAGVTIDIQKSATETLLASQVLSSFYIAQNTGDVRTLWYHYAIDYSRPLKIRPPTNIRGMQTLINILDGYYAYQQERGIMYEMISQTTYDITAGRNVSWQSETERFIEWAYGIKIVLMTVTDKYELTVDIDTNLFHYKNSNPRWPDGTQIAISSRTGSIPTPLLTDINYYVHNVPTPGKMVISMIELIDENTPTGIVSDLTKYSVTINCNNYTTAYVNVAGSLIQTYGELVTVINDSLALEDAVCAIIDGNIVITSTINEQKSIILIQDDELFRRLPDYSSMQSSYGTVNGFNLAITSDVNNPSNIVKLTSEGSGILYASAYAPVNRYPSFEINPSRDNIWISTPQGLLADVVSGPYKDYKIQQTTFDQYGRPLTADKLTVYRQDLRSHVQIRPEIANDLVTTYTTDPYNYIHFGSGHLFIEAYEHFILFEDYTTSGGLIYDPFLGLRTGTLHLDYFESNNYTLRPNMGGYYLTEGTFQRNIEGSIEDMQNIYATHSYPEVKEFTERGRAITGYQSGRYPFLDLVDVPRKSQFDFYRGMIKHKGSQESLVAYKNSKQLEEITVDEYWAWKVAEYGESRKRIFPEIKLKSSDGISDDIRMMFLTNMDILDDSDISTATSQGFVPISFSVNNDRWNQFPQQRDEIQTTMFFNGKVSSRVAFIVDITEPVYNKTYGIQYWLDKTDMSVHKWNETNSSWEASTDYTITTDNEYVYFVHAICDTTRIIRYNTDLNDPDFGAHIFDQGAGIDLYTDINSEVTRIAYDSCKDVIMMFLIEPSVETNSPAHLIDVVSNTTVKTIPMWHPAIGVHYHQAMHNIDAITDTDPALYSSSIKLDAVSEQFWNTQQVGTVWVDTSQLGYLPYYDKAIYPDTNDRLYNWGKQTEWSQPKVYQWVKSPVPPASWTSQASAQKNLTSIPQQSKISGTAKKSMFNRTRKSYLAALSGSPIISVTIEDAPTMYTGDEVMFTSSDTLPPAITLNTQYYISSVITSGNQNTFDIVDINGDSVDLDGGVGDLYVVPSFDKYLWIKQPNMFEKHIIAVDFPGTGGVFEPTFILTKSLWNDGDYVQIYINGTKPTVYTFQVQFNGTDYILDLAESGIQFYEKDIVIINRKNQQLTSDQESFNPAVEDDSSIMIQWTEDYEFSTATYSQGNNDAQVSVTSFYFWVENNIVNEINAPGKLSPIEIASSFNNIPIPYFIVQDPVNDPTYRDQYGFGIGLYGNRWSVVDLNDPQYIMPIVYRQSIIRKLSDIVRDDDRYIIQFVCNFAKRDQKTNHKDFHEDWMLIRRGQSDRIDTRLWTALTEAVVGYKTDSNVPVPSYETIQYDALNGTDTQYGLAANQAFVNKSYAIDTIKYNIGIIDLEETPIDVSSFLSKYPFDTPTNIKDAMDEIYNTFPASVINNIWFDTLLDALATKSKYKGIMKTSWISVEGTQPFRSTVE